MDDHAPDTARALVLVGHGRYEDRWHDVAATAQRVCEVLTGCGLAPAVRGTFPDALDGYGQDGATPDLLVVLAGSGRRDPAFDGTDEDWAPFHARLAALVRGGVPLLALHASAMTFADSPHWAELVGGRWVEGVSMHPPIGEARFPVLDAAHPVTAGLAAVEAFDERYAYLDVDPACHVFLGAEHEGRTHPVGWVAPKHQVLYDALGHDVRSYDSPSRRRLLDQEVRWLVAGGEGRQAGGPGVG